MRALPLLAALALVGCVGAEDEPEPSPSDTGEGKASEGIAPEGPPRDLVVFTRGQYPLDPAFDPAALEAVANTPLTLTLKNQDVAPLVEHDWVLEGVAGAATARVGAGSETSVTFRAPAATGEYVYYCSVGDHRARGMEGVLLVKA